MCAAGQSAVVVIRGEAGNGRRHCCTPPGSLPVFESRRSRASSGIGLSDKPANGYDTGTQAGDMVADAMKLVAGVVLPGTGHFVAEESPDEMLEALTAFLAPYRDRPLALAGSPS